MEFFKKYRNIILKYSFLLFLMIFTVYLVFQNLDINSIEKIKDIISECLDYEGYDELEENYSLPYQSEES